MSKVYVCIFIVVKSVRALNTHGRPSDFSAEAMASTVRILTEDIMFGPELAVK